jgi:hypothetical protein
MPHDAIRGYRGRHCVGVTDSLPAGPSQGEADRLGDILGTGGREELSSVMATRLEQNKN